MTENIRIRQKKVQEAAMQFDRSRPQMLVTLIAMILVVSACGGGSAGDTAETSPEPTPTTTPGTAPTTIPGTTEATTPTTMSTSEPTETTPSPEGIEGPILVGLAAPFTGEKGFLGPNLNKGVEVALTRINEAEGAAGADVQLTTADTEGTAQGAIAAVQKLIESDGVHAMVGPTSVTIMGVLERIQASGVPDMIIAGTAALDTTIKGETTFRSTASDSVVGPAMAQAAVDAGNTSCAIVVESLEGAQSVKETIQPAFETLEGEILKVVDIAAGQGSYRSEILQLVGDPAPECVFFEVSPTTASQFWQNASEFPEIAEMLWIGNDVVLNEDSIAAIQPVIEQLELIAISPASIGPGREDYLAAYQEIFPDDDEPVILADLGYDAMNIIALAVHAAGSIDQTAVAAQIPAVSRDGEACTTFAACKEILDTGGDPDYEGASGSVNIDDTGNSVSGFGVFEVAGTEVVQTGEITEESLVDLLSELGGA